MSGDAGPAEEARAVPVAAFLADPRTAAQLTLVAGHAGLGRPLSHARVQKNGLALAGHFHGVVPSRIQVVGETEQTFLDAMGPAQRAAACKGLFSLGLSCVVVTKTATPSADLIEAAEATQTPLLVGGERSSATINAIHATLDDLLAPTTRIHGVLVDVFGVGLLLLGKSGIGKSECALELVLRGHRLVADDVVQIDWRPPGMVFGEPAELLKNHMEIRGLGILNIKDMFGVTAVRERKRIDIVTQLVEWHDGMVVDRLGIDDRYQDILGAKVRELTVPVQPGRDMGSILEIAARNELLRRAGMNSARDFVARLAARRNAPQRRRYDTVKTLQRLTPEELAEAAEAKERYDGESWSGSGAISVPTPPSSAHAVDRGAISRGGGREDR